MADIVLIILYSFHEKSLIDFHGIYLGLGVITELEFLEPGACLMAELHLIFVS